MPPEDQIPPSAEGAPAPDDQFKNLKSEMNRKLDATNAQLAAVLEQLKASTAPKPAPTPEKKVSVFDDEEAYARSIEERTERRITENLARQQAQTQKYQAVVNEIYSEFPEVSDESGPLARRAQEIYKTLPEDERASALAMKTAVAQAAAEQGVKPKSKRTSSDDDNFSISSSSTGARSRPAKGEALDARTIEFARMLGQNVEDPKYMERLKKAAKRTKWSKYE